MTDTTELLEAPANQSEERGPRRSLSGMLLPELKALAGELGIKGTSQMRKGDLIAAIHSRRAGAASAQPRLDESSVNGHPRSEPTQGEHRGDQGDRGEAPRETQHHEPQHHETQHHEPQHHEPQHHEQQHHEQQHHDQQHHDEQHHEQRREGPYDEPQRDQPQHDRAPQRESERGGEYGQAGDQHRSHDGGEPGSGDTGGGASDSPTENAADHADRDGGGGSGQAGIDGPQRTSSRRNRRNRRDRTDRPVGERPVGENDGADAPERPTSRPNTGGQNAGAQIVTRPNPQQNTQQRDNQQGDDDLDGDGTRRGRRYRDRNRRGRDRFTEGPTDVEVRDDDVLLPVAGILDVLDSYAFVRTSGYLTGPNDVYVSLSQVRKYGLRRGDAVTGAVRAPRDGEQTRQKFNALVRLDTINGQDPDQLKNRPEFTKLTPLYPNERLRLETDAHLLTTRVIDLVMPVGKGQRALIVSPPKAGKTSVLQAIANAIARNNPECHLMVVLVDERPEEVTDMQRSVKGEVIASTFDRPPADHTQLAELAIERAKRLVEMGRDVVVLLDSITRLGRAYNLAAPASGRILSGGVDSTALFPPKRFLGAARNIEHGGSLTIFASALVETGSAGDTVIFEEFKGTGNAELKLDRRIADKRVFPAIDIDQSSTRKEDLLMAPDEHAVVLKLRRVLSALDSQQALDLVLDRLRKTRSNVEFLMQVAATTPGADRM